MMTIASGTKRRRNKRNITKKRENEMNKKKSVVKASKRGEQLEALR